MILCVKVTSALNPIRSRLGRFSAFSLEG